MPSPVGRETARWSEAVFPHEEEKARYTSYSTVRFKNTFNIAARCSAARSFIFSIFSGSEACSLNDGGVDADRGGSCGSDDTAECISWGKSL